MKVDHSYPSMALISGRRKGSNDVTGPTTYGNEEHHRPQSPSLAEPANGDGTDGSFKYELEFAEQNGGDCSDRL